MARPSSMKPGKLPLSKSWRTTGRVLAGLLAVYVLSYLIISRKGFYRPVAYGLVQGANGEVVFAPKSYGYHWIPFEGFESADGPDGTSLLGWAYYPILLVDRAVWHTDDRWENYRDRIKSEYETDIIEFR